MEILSNIGAALFLLAGIGVFGSIIFTLISVIRKNAEKRKKHLKRLILSTALAISGIVMVIVAGDTTPPTITAIGKSVEYGTKITVDKIVDATDESSENIDLLITEVAPAQAIIGNTKKSVEFQIPGDYVLTVQAKDDSENVATEKINVSVVDKTSPTFVDKIDKLEVEYDKEISLTQNKKDKDAIYIVAEDEISDVNYAIQEITSKSSETDEKAYSAENQEVSFHQIGDYQVLIEAKDDSGNVSTDTVDVSVIDKTAPTFNGIPEKMTFAEKDTDIDYLQGITAEDAIDGDLTEKISVNTSKVKQKIPGKYKVTYTVSDQSGNKAKKIASIVIEDTIAPTISLSQKSYSLNVGDSTPDYSSDITVKDTSDSSPSIDIDDSDVDYDEPGTYEVTFIATDSSGNSSKETAEVTVKSASTESYTNYYSDYYSDTSSGATVYITKTGGKYHTGNCRYLRQSKIPIDESSAISRGYDACSVCNP